MNQRTQPPDAATLTSAGLSNKDVKAWTAARPKWRGSFAADRKAFAAFSQKSTKLLAGRRTAGHGDEVRPRRDARGARATPAASRRHHLRCADREATRFVRVEELAAAAAKLIPGLVPSQKDIAAEEGLLQSQKAGLEIDQGLLVSAVLRSEQSGRHLCHAMLLPTRQANDLLPKFVKDGASNCPARRSSGAARRHSSPISIRVS